MALAGQASGVLWPTGRLFLNRDKKERMSATWRSSNGRSRRWEKDRLDFVDKFGGFHRHRKCSLRNGHRRHKIRSGSESAIGCQLPPHRLPSDFAFFAGFLQRLPNESRWTFGGGKMGRLRRAGAVRLFSDTFSPKIAGFPSSLKLGPVAGSRGWKFLVFVFGRLLVFWHGSPATLAAGKLPR
jgi:hypothetical protein